jgi:hypothetical protein
MVSQKNDAISHFYERLKYRGAKLGKFAGNAILRPESCPVNAQ